VKLLSAEVIFSDTLRDAIADLLDIARVKISTNEGGAGGAQEDIPGVT
jgi:hypothetical protein